MNFNSNSTLRKPPRQRRLLLVTPPTPSTSAQVQAQGSLRVQLSSPSDLPQSSSRDANGGSAKADVTPNSDCTLASEDLSGDEQFEEAEADHNSGPVVYKMTPEAVLNLLKQSSSGYYIKPKTESSSEIWNRVDLVCGPAGQSCGYVQCKSCKKLFTYSNRSGTSHINRHSCNSTNSKGQRPITSYAGISGPVPASLKKLVIEACATFVSKEGLMHRLPKSLKQEVDTRWNSLLILLQSVSDQIDTIDRILVNRDQLGRAMNVERDVLLDLVHFLKPFKDFSDDFEGSSQPTLHSVLPGFKLLEKHCQVADCDDDSMRELKNCAIGVIQKLLDPQDLHKIATILNPKMKSLRMVEATERAHLYEELADMCSAVILDDHENDASAVSPAKKTRPENRYAEFEDYDSDHNESEMNEVGRYLKLKVTKTCSITEFWKLNSKEFPRLSRVARRVLAIPASSAPSERNFSLAGHTVAKRRTKLNPSKVDDLLFLNSNTKLRKRLKRN